MPIRKGYGWGSVIPPIGTGDYLVDPVPPSTGVPGGLGAFSLIPKLFIRNAAGNLVPQSPDAPSSSSGGGLPIVPIAIAGAAVVGFIIWKRRKGGRK